jgi:hypothetical protein
MSEATAAAQSTPETQLPPVPATLAGEDGAPRSGLFSGSLADARFAALKGAYAASFVQRRLMEKKWQYVIVATEEMMLSLAVVDAGYLASGICAVFDRGSRRLLADENPILPSPCVEIGESPGDGLSARLIGPGVRARIDRAGGKIAVRASWAHVEIDLLLDANRAPAPMTAIAPVGQPGRFDLTQKTVLVPAQGEVRAGNIRFAVQGELAGLDYTHGYLARETAWRWAFAGGRQGARRVAFNLSEGFVQGEGENAVWVDGDPQRVGKVGFSFDSGAPLSPWRMRSEDGRLDLAFQPEGYRTQTVDLKLILSRYVQPFGTFSGHVTAAGGERVALDGLPGVAEDHASRW